MERVRTIAIIRAVSVTTVEKVRKNMKTKTIFEDEFTLVKAVWLNGKFLYTVTYTRDVDGICCKTIRVYADGKIEIQ